MKLLTLTIVSLLTIASTLNLKAQTLDPQQEAKQFTEKQKTELSLTDEQYPKVEAINVAFFTTVDSLKSTDASKMAKLKTLKKADEARTDSLKKILTDEQYAKFKKQRSENKKEFKGRYKNRG